jgi:hypothetical protein
MRSYLPLVMPGLVPGIHEYVIMVRYMGVDGRVKPGHDDD